MNASAATQRRLRLALQISNRDWKLVNAAAKDAHMRVDDYCRTMVLAAAGMGGIGEHLDRAIRASAKVDRA